MKQIYFNTFLWIVAFLGFSFIGHAQEKEKEVVKKEQYVIKVKDDKGYEKILKWDGTGEMPAEMKELMEKEGMEVPDGEAGEKIVIKKKKKEGGEATEEHKIVKKRAYKVAKEEDGEKIELEWDGTGEMPEDMKKLLEEHDLELKGIHEAHETMDVEVEVDDTGKQKKKIKMKIKDKDGNIQEKVVETDKDVEIIKTDDGKEVIVKIEKAAEEDQNPNDVQLGIVIENADTGIRILDTVEGTKAAASGVEEGDIISAVNGVKVRTMMDLISQVGKFKAGDIVQLLINRDGERKQIEVELSPRSR